MEEQRKVKRRRFSKAEKVKILKAFKAGTTCTALAQEHRISPVLIYQWRRAMAKQERDNKSIDYQELLTELDNKNKKIEQLQKALSDSVVEAQILKKALEVVKKNMRLKKWSLSKKSSRRE